MPTGNYTAGDVFYATDDNTVARTPSTTFGRSRMNDASPAAARTALELGTAAVEAASAFQPADATLTALAGVTLAANKGLYATGADALATFDLTAFGRSLGGLAGAAALRTAAELGTIATQQQGAAQADSVAILLVGIVDDFNALLAKLRAAGIIAT